MVVDDRLLIVGSFNDTEPATTLNDENIVVIGDLEETDPVAQADQQQLAGFARTEIDRIITDLARQSDPCRTYAEGAAHDRPEGDYTVNPSACRSRTCEAVPTQLACSSPRRWCRRDVTIGSWQAMCWVASWRAAVPTR
jgi:phosphatidylserine/phosphatidylglycerophosphate/cardiolipin synthase-like enzyme